MSIVRGVKTLQEIIESDYPAPQPIVKNLLNAGEIALFIARQKVGKSIFTLQLAIDIACGTHFLGRYETTAQRVLYIDYENRFSRIKKRGVDLANGRSVNQFNRLYIKAFELISQRDVGLVNGYTGLQQCVREIEPAVLIIDPLRFALSLVGGRSSADESVALEAIEHVTSLRQIKPDLATILVHHVKKRQDFTNKSLRLREDPLAWMDQVYGSQALLAHAENLWAIEEDGDGYVFANVPRADDQMVIFLEKHPDSERFLLASSYNFKFKTETQQQAWNQLDENFGWREAMKLGINSGLFDRMIRQARAAKIVTQDPKTKRYTKIQYNQQTQ